MITWWWNEGDNNQRTLQNLNPVQIVLNKAANSETEPLVESNLHVNIQIKIRNENKKKNCTYTPVHGIRHTRGLMGVYSTLVLSAHPL